jgi:hypothetical protein
VNAKDALFILRTRCSSNTTVIAFFSFKEIGSSNVPCCQYTWGTFNITELPDHFIYTGPKLGRLHVTAA